MESVAGCAVYALMRPVAGGRPATTGGKVPNTAREYWCEGSDGGEAATTLESVAGIAGAVAAAAAAVA